MSAAVARFRLERFGESGLSQNRVGGVSAWYPDGNREVSCGYRTMPDFMAALTLPHKRAACGQQQFPEHPVELRRHSGGGQFGFAQRGDLEKDRGRIQIGMIVRQKVERHRRDFRKKIVKGGGIGGGRYVVAMAAPYRRFIVPYGGNREDGWLRHAFSDHPDYYTTPDRGMDTFNPPRVACLTGRSPFAKAGCRRTLWTR
jgi:hypothetical protein